jgi:hypothetical protein
MVVSARPFSEVASVSVLFPPDVVPVVDIFRTLGDFEEHYDVNSLDHIENRLARKVNRDVAKGVVSDALLLAFGLRRERIRRMDYAPLRSRRGTLDEYRLLALIAAAFWHDMPLAAEAATALDVSRAQPLVALAFDIARRLESAGLKLEAPDARVFRLAAASPVEMSGPASGADGDLKFNFDL